MPRYEANNPTERMLRVLDDIAALEAYAQVADEMILQHNPELITKLPPRPVLVNVALERQRLGMQLNHIRRMRRNMQAKRDKGPRGNVIRVTRAKGLELELSPEILADIAKREKEIAEEAEKLNEVPNANI